MTTNDQLTTWTEEAAKLGREAGLAAASWATDGNTSQEHYLRLAQMMDDGDPQLDEYLPARPNLSGEWADSATPNSLAADIMGADWETHGYNAPDLLPEDAVQAICEAWEQGCEEAFSHECERLVREALA